MASIQDAEENRKERAPYSTGTQCVPGPAWDPWAHRREGMRCRTCMYFVSKPAPSTIDPRTGMLGRCRRHAPAVALGWPAAFEADWCGDHKLDETKV